MDKVLEGESVSSVQPSHRSLNWLLSVPHEIAEVGTRLVMHLIDEVFAKGADALGFEVVRHAGSDDVLPCVLMKTDSGYVIGVDASLGENSIHPLTLEGAGEICPAHGHKPLLMLVYLQQRLRKYFPGASRPLVAFCDEQGNAFDYQRFDSLEPIIKRLGFCYDEVRADAEKLGLVSELIRLADIDAGQDYFF